MTILKNKVLYCALALFPVSAGGVSIVSQEQDGIEEADADCRNLFSWYTGLPRISRRHGEDYRVVKLEENGHGVLCETSVKDNVVYDLKDDDYRHKVTASEPGVATANPVWRRFSEFLRLEAELQALTLPAQVYTHVNPPRTLPSKRSSSLWNWFHDAVSKAEAERVEATERVEPLLKYWKNVEALSAGIDSLKQEKLDQLRRAFLTEGDFNDAPALKIQLATGDWHTPESHLSWTLRGHTYRHRYLDFELLDKELKGAFAFWRAEMRQQKELQEKLQVALSQAEPTLKRLRNLADNRAHLDSMGMEKAPALKTIKRLVTFEAENAELAEAIAGNLEQVREIQEAWSKAEEKKLPGLLMLPRRKNFPSVFRKRHAEEEEEEEMQKASRKHRDQLVEYLDARLAFAHGGASGFRRVVASILKSFGDFSILESFEN